MSTPDADAFAGELAARSLAADDPTGWFEELYTEADGGRAVVPWDRGEPRPALVEWARARALTGRGRRALVVGCGLGDDAEFIAGLGFDTVAFDVSPTAVRGAQSRFPGTAVDFVTVDLFAPPADWSRSFDLVVEIFTVQALPPALRERAVGQVAGMVAPGGTLIVIAMALTDPADRDAGPPWLMSRADIEAFGTDGLRPVSIEGPTEGRWRAEFTR